MSSFVLEYFYFLEALPGAKKPASSEENSIPEGETHTNVKCY